MGKTSDSVIFREVQRLRQWWLVLVAVGLAGLGWVMFVQQIVRDRPFGDNPAPDWVVWLIWLLLGIGEPVFILWLARMVVEVRPDRITVRWIPFTKREIPLADVVAAEARTYRPIREYGGWGIRGWSRRRMAYNVSGNRGVAIDLVDGRHVLIGSQRADELAVAIGTATGGRVRSRKEETA
jgi:hypothetical protein